MKKNTDAQKTDSLLENYTDAQKIEMLKATVEMLQGDVESLKQESESLKSTGREILSRLAVAEAERDEYRRILVERFEFNPDRGTFGLPPKNPDAPAADPSRIGLASTITGRSKDGELFGATGELAAVVMTETEVHDHGIDPNTPELTILHSDGTVQSNPEKEEET